MLKRDNRDGAGTRYNQSYKFIKLSSTLQDFIQSCDMQFVEKQSFLNKDCKAVVSEVETIEV